MQTLQKGEKKIGFTVESGDEITREKKNLFIDFTDLKITFYHNVTS